MKRIEWRVFFPLRNLIKGVSGIGWPRLVQVVWHGAARQHKQQNSPVLYVCCGLGCALRSWASILGFAVEEGRAGRKALERERERDEERERESEREREI